MIIVKSSLHIRFHWLTVRNKKHFLLVVYLTLRLRASKYLPNGLCIYSVLLLFSFTAIPFLIKSNLRHLKSRKSNKTIPSSKLSNQNRGPKNVITKILAARTAARQKVESVNTSCVCVNFRIPQFGCFAFELRRCAGVG